MAFMAGTAQDPTMQGGGYSLRRDPTRQGINRPLKSWDFELSDPQWRRFFDALKVQGIDKMAADPNVFRESQALPIQAGLQAGQPGTSSLEGIMAASGGTQGVVRKKPAQGVKTSRGMTR